MKLGSLKEGGRDGTLVVVSRDLKRAVRVPDIATTLQRALEDWTQTAPRLNAVSEALNLATAETINGEPVFAVDFASFASPLPRAYEFVDGSGNKLIVDVGTDGIISGWRVGVPPQVDYVEGCG